MKINNAVQDEAIQEAPSLNITETEQGEPMPERPPIVCGVIFIFFLNITHLLQQNILSPVCPSKTSYDITEFPKEPEISTSENNQTEVTEGLVNWKPQMLEDSAADVTIFHVCTALLSSGQDGRLPSLSRLSCSLPDLGSLTPKPSTWECSLGEMKGSASFLPVKPCPACT